MVTGAGSGIGRAIATGLAEAGASVSLAGRNLEKLEKTGVKINASGLYAVPFTVDMSKPDRILELVASVIKEFGRICLIKISS